MRMLCGESKAPPIGPPAAEDFLKKGLLQYCECCIPGTGGVALLGHPKKGTSMQGYIKQYRCNELTAADFETLAAISRAAFAEHKQQGIDFRDTTITGDEMAQSLTQGGDTVFVYYLEGRAVGYCRGHIRCQDNTKHLLHDGIATMPECRKMHIGRKLTDEMEAWAVWEGAEYALLNTSDRAERIKAYHHAHGYKNWYYGHWSGKSYISVFMRKDLGKPYPRIKRLARLWASWIKVHARYTRHGKNRLPFRAYGYLCGKLGIRARL